MGRYSRNHVMLYPKISLVRFVRQIIRNVRIPLRVLLERLIGELIRPIRLRLDVIRRRRYGLRLIRFQKRYRVDRLQMNLVRVRKRLERPPLT